ncbi:MAG: bifunctional homocysteine S-methyltransferase/methylenetetrahydrofolate reductase [Planctomycetes bacterium]|nr:bifunctional homocysteine S-methyltransferase/methylenetetrahydrofolate reductase [Planctomycetota bacterium]
MPDDFLVELRKRVILCDGGTGTSLYAKGVYINRSYEELNLSQPDLVREVHRDFLRAGAEVVEANTFAANTVKLKPYGLAADVRQIVAQGIRLAREEARGAAWVAASVGPLGVEIEPYGRMCRDEARDLFREPIEAALEAEADLLLLETFGNVEEIIVAIEAARAAFDAAGRPLPLIAQISFRQDGSTLTGTPAERAAEMLARAGADVIGSNCALGPRPMLVALQRMAAATDLPLSGQPNAGNPEYVDGRLMYMSTPEYFATFAQRFIQSGVRLVGGCCGTGPEHIRAMARTIRSLAPSRIEVADRAGAGKEVRGVEPAPTGEKSRLAAKIAAGTFVSSVELLPPRGSDPSKVIRAARTLAAAGVDAVNVPDGPRASARMSPFALVLLLEREAGIETILHYTCRDRNLLGMQSDLLGAHAMGLHNILAVTGDPPKLGSYPDATAVYDMDSIGLAKLISNLNRGLDVAGNPLGEATAIHVGVGANPGAIDLDEEVRRFRRKVEAGAEFCMTQPVFDPALLERFLDRIAGFRIPILVGILPIASARVAEFLHNEVPGMQLPDRVREAMAEADDRGAARAKGIEIAQEALIATKSLASGVYVMSPAGGAKTALEVLSVLGDLRGATPTEASA